MAFVYKEERKFDLNTPKGDLPGPGNYFAQTSPKFLKVNQAPFQTQEEKLKMSLNKNPGPGTYYHDETDKHFQHIQAKAELRALIQADNVEQGNSKPFDTIQGKRYQIRDTVEMLGFDIKAKRFINKENDLPGPGDYFPSQKQALSARPFSSTSTVKAYSSEPLIKMRSRLQSAKAQKISSIPYKDNGYLIGNNQQLIKHKDPEIYLQYKGDKDDCVGPGSYNVDNPCEWHKGGTNWSKMKSGRGNSASTAKTRPQTAAEVREKNLAQYNVPSNKKLQNYNMTRVLLAQSAKRRENQKKMEEMSASKENTYYDEFQKFTYRQPPGPGYYIDINKESSFQSFPLPETRQVFGSNELRFNEIKGNFELGPTTYFPSDNNVWTTKNKVEKLKGKRHKVPFSTNAKRFNNKGLDGDRTEEPGPGAYDPKQKPLYERNRFNSTGIIFNGREKRFDEKTTHLKWQIDTPGPGSYIDPYTATGTSNTIQWNGLYLDVRRGNELKRPKTSTMNPLSHKKPDHHPEVGTYNPDKTMTIAYKAKKNASKKQSEEIGFNSTKTKKKTIEKNNVGPGFYYREKTKLPLQIFPPFHQSDGKLKHDDGLMIGPGQYDPTSYFDWNKKTYNASYI